MALSATECTDSASIEADPVTANATNFVAAMPKFAASAARTARRPADSWLELLLMGDHFLHDACLQFLDGRDRARIDAQRDGEVHRRVVDQLDQAG